MVADPVRNWYYAISLVLLSSACIYISLCTQSASASKSGIAANSTASSPFHLILRGGFGRSFTRLVGAVGQLSRGPRSSFRSFQFNYLVVYSLVFMADWLQGPYIYALYKSYGYELDSIALLFVAGFLSSAVFGTFVGSLADRFGRKLGSVLFCGFYILSCLTKLSTTFSVLMVGRLLGGISTSLLFSVFESWMIYEHRSRAFDESLLSDTFAWATFANGLVAIVSGLIANIVVEVFGLVSPFMVAIVFLGLALVIIQSTWSENYGNKIVSSPSPSFLSVVDSIYHDPNILAVGTMQFCFESAMYTFVFLWSPVLETVTDSRIALPFGVMFSSFMVCIMLGSSLYKSLTLRQFSNELIANATFGAAALTFLVPAVTRNEAIIYIAFNVFELCCGVYFPAMASIRSKVVPESTRSTVMNIFRVPLNLIVVLILLKANSLPASLFFVVCAGLNVTAFVFAKQLSATSALVVVYQEASARDEEAALDLPTNNKERFDLQPQETMAGNAKSAETATTIQ
ncbi:hypothetical protein BC831DRAFT_398784 [Entophlyctis helioformis]|nr:hypothetical protein BC831DRAFT_398784 [Entophlyctis helioformis]